MNTLPSPLQCLIIEDEPLAAEILRGYISDTPFLKLAADCRDAVQAMDILHTQHIDLVFLDIHLPRMSGLDFLHSQRPTPSVIITSAYADYALSGYEFSVQDYLLKPIAFERFLKSVTTLWKKKKEEQKLYSDKQQAPPFHFFNVNKKMQKVWLDDILYVESMKDYCSIHLPPPARPLVTKATLNEIEQIIGTQLFLRIHRSYLVALAAIESYDAVEVTVGTVSLPIGRSYKEKVMQHLQGERSG